MPKAGGGRDGRTPSGELTIKMLRRGEVALSSTNYNPTREDYVEDYEEFKKISPYYATTRDRS